MSFVQPLSRLRRQRTGCGSQHPHRAKLALAPAGRCPNNSSLLPPLAAVVVVALLGEVALRKQ